MDLSRYWRAKLCEFGSIHRRYPYYLRDLLAESMPNNKVLQIMYLQSGGVGAVAVLEEGETPDLESLRAFAGG